jgi:hypothetical protein
MLPSKEVIHLIEQKDFKSAWFSYLKIEF